MNNSREKNLFHFSPGRNDRITEMSENIKHRQAIHADPIPKINTKKRPTKVSGVNTQCSSISLFPTLKN
jgi:hypothetical protein